MPVTMRRTTPCQSLDGVIVALLTPVDADGRVDHGALRRLVERLVDRGVTGVSPLGSTGEGYSLGLEQRLAVVDTVARSVPAGMPVIPGVFAHNHEQAVAEIAAYADRGATAVLAAPPAYYPLAAAEQEALLLAAGGRRRAAPRHLQHSRLYQDPDRAGGRGGTGLASPRRRTQGFRQGSRLRGALLDAVAASGAGRGLLRPDRDGLDARLLHAGRCPWHHLRERERRARGGARRLRGGQGRQA